MEPDNLRRSWGTIRKAAGLGDMRFHDLRHTCVTLLLNLGVPPRSSSTSSATATSKSP
ncbi:Phage integrase family protein [Nonomuraea maritima]|uniref:Phage integrase family protein n=1 Tax=Nonomuraea maritima TaxID=683260 RepID=A0A1G9K8B3_9ACTN|nr:Phage integrase family protein [Nonomuraea maritima]